MSELTPLSYIPELVECCTNIEAIQAEIEILKQQVAALIAAQTPTPP